MFGDIVLSFVIGIYEDYNLNCSSKSTFASNFNQNIVNRNCNYKLFFFLFFLTFPITLFAFALIEMSAKLSNNAIV